MSYPLIVAVKKNVIPLVNQLIESGVNVNGVDEDGRTALYWAAHGGFVECAKLLLEAKADVNTGNRFKWTPLHVVWNFGHLACGRV